MLAREDWTLFRNLGTIAHCFSSRLYGLRNYKKTLKECLK